MPPEVLEYTKMGHKNMTLLIYYNDVTFFGRAAVRFFIFPWGLYGVCDKKFSQMG